MQRTPAPPSTTALWRCSRRVGDALAKAEGELFPDVATTGQAAARLADDVLVEAGFQILKRKHRVPRTGVTVDFLATDGEGATWFFDVAGAFTSHRGGLLRSRTVCEALGRANALRGPISNGVRLVFLATPLPHRPSEGDTAMRAAGPDAFFDAVDFICGHAAILSFGRPPRGR